MATVGVKGLTETEKFETDKLGLQFCFRCMCDSSATVQYLHVHDVDQHVCRFWCAI